MSTPSYRELLERARKSLQEAGIAEAANDAWILFSETFSMDFSRFFLIAEKEAEKDARISLFQERIRRRESREPLQYILGEQSFMGLSFSVNPDVLIPRQDTEILVEQVLSDQKEREKEDEQRRGGSLENKETILDLCTGSGCILISLLKLGHFVSGTGSDISEKALFTAKENAMRNKVTARWVKSDLFSGLSRERYDVITANPPYVSEEDYKDLAPEVRDHEPPAALLAEENGLSFYPEIIKNSKAFLKEGGLLYLEIGDREAASVCGFLRQNAFAKITVIQDLAGRDRVVKACLQGGKDV